MSQKKAKRQVIKQNIGIDISKDDYKVCFYCLDENSQKFIKGSRTFKNTLTGFTSFMSWVEKKRNTDLVVRITMEATGVYYENLAHFLNDNGYYVSVILANQSKAYADSLNLKTKTDKVDAQMLGQMGIERDLRQWQPASANMRLVKQLTRDRAALVNEKTALLNKNHALSASFEPPKKVISRLKQRLQLIKQQIKEVDKEIIKAVEQDELLKQRVNNIGKTKGLGVLTIATVIAETNGFKLFSSISQLISYAGYDVVQKESGSSVKGKTRISKKGNKHIRRVLHFPALIIVKHEDHFKQIFERVLDRTGIKMKAYVAVQRKILILIYTLFKNNVPYDPNYHKKNESTKENSNQNCRQDTNPAYSGCLL